MHEAARYGQSDAALFIIENFRENLGNNNFNNSGENFIEEVLFTIEISREQKIEFIKELDQKISIETIFNIISPGSETVKAKCSGNRMKLMDNVKVS